VTGRWFSLGTPVSSTDKSDRRDKAEILLKVAYLIFNTINQTTFTSILVENRFIFIFLDRYLLEKPHQWCNG
jgi:hypothetical protein